MRSLSRSPFVVVPWPSAVPNLSSESERLFYIAQPTTWRRQNGVPPFRRVSRRRTEFKKTTFNDFSYIIHLASHSGRIFSVMNSLPVCCWLHAWSVVVGHQSQFMPGLIIALMFIQLRIKSSLWFFIFLPLAFSIPFGRCMVSATA